MTEGDESRDRPGDEMVRLTVAEAADQLGISEAGVRKRVQRGQIPHERDDTGRVFVWVSPGETRHAESRDEPGQSRDELVEELRDQVRSLREELARKDAILLRMAESIPQLEPPSETPGGPETGADIPMGPTPRGQRRP